MSKNHNPVMEEIIAKIQSGAISSYTELESTVSKSLLSTDEKDDILEQYMSYRLTGGNGSGGSWGSSPTLPTVKAIVFKTIVGGVGGAIVFIPASINWKAEVIQGGVTALGGNTIGQYEVAYGDTRPDGQAHLPLTLNVPENTIVRINYQPL